MSDSVYFMIIVLKHTNENHKEITLGNSFLSGIPKNTENILWTTKPQTTPNHNTYTRWKKPQGYRDKLNKFLFSIRQKWNVAWFTSDKKIIIFRKKPKSFFIPLRQPPWKTNEEVKKANSKRNEKICNTNGLFVCFSELPFVLLSTFLL